VAEAVKHSRALAKDIAALQAMNDHELLEYSEAENIPFELIENVRTIGRLPVVTFAAGGIATPSDAALMMKLGMDGVFVGSGIFKSENPELMARAIVQSVTHYSDPTMIAKVSEGLGEPMQK
jgi:pyridoxal 5'-phosphate synthase pdxS subunit